MLYRHKNTETLLEASKEVGLGVNAQKTKCIFMSGHQNADQSHNMVTANKRF
jgi:hypothetical protein